MTIIIMFSKCFVQRKNSVDRDRLNTFVRHMHIRCTRISVCMYVDACARMQLERIAWYT